MKKLTQLVIENPMDVILAHKRTIKAGELLKLSLSAQTAFTTAISEVARVLLDKAGTCLFTIYFKNEITGCFLLAIFDFKKDSAKQIDEAEFSYAKKLVKTFELIQHLDQPQIQMSLNLPRSSKISDSLVNDVIKYFSAEAPENFYEEIKNQKIKISKEAEKTVEELVKYQEIDEKKNEFLAIASHELKTPLAIIKGFASLAIMMGKNENAELKEYLLKINQQADKINKLITQLLDVSKIEAAQLDFSWEEVKINEYLAGEIDSVKMILPHNTIIVNLGTNVVVRIDKLRMEQVLSNLFSNASKYAEKGATIYFSSKIHNNNTVHFSIKDEGIGMSEETKERVFEKFFREQAVVKKYSGLGMGLYITSKIIKEHGGEIWIDSTPGEGSTFHFSLSYIEVASA